MEPSLKRDVSLFPDFFPVGRSDKILSKSSLANGFSSSREDWRPVTVRCSFPDGRGVPPAARYIQKNAKFCAALGSMRLLIWASGRPVLVRQFVRVLEDQIAQAQHCHAVAAASANAAPSSALDRATIKSAIRITREPNTTAPASPKELLMELLIPLRRRRQSLSRCLLRGSASLERSLRLRKNIAGPCSRIP
jgi:hypothetical protein